MPALPLPRPFHHLPAHILNGIFVALGIGMVQASIGAAAGAGAAFAATGGAVYASLADLPNAPHRAWRRVALAAVIGCVVSVAVSLLRSHAVLLGFATALVTFVSAGAWAWGPRAGPISFVGILAIVFTLAAPPLRDVAAQGSHAVWTVCGAAVYVAWAAFASRLLQPRYRSLALADALAASAQLLHSRALLLSDDPARLGDASPLQTWIGCEAALSTRLQAARDFLFAAPDTPRSRRQTALLLFAIDLRDTLLACELDLDEFGHDGPDGKLRAGLADNLNDMAGTLDGLARIIRHGLSLAAPRPVASPERPPGAALERLRSAGLFASDAWRAQLAGVLLDRARHMADDLAKMQAMLAATDAGVSLRRDELQLFVSVEGWPLAALKAQAHAGSPVLRHAARAGLALGSAYFIGEALPWASHPAWLVLSVGVVLRGNLEQTLARRNARVAGTVIGCGVVLLLARLGTAWLSTTVFLVAVGVAHSFIGTRYLVTAAAASVMALLQAHLAHPVGQLAVGERVADTVLGALLAWGFSYVLPAWERGGMPRTAGRVTQALAALARQTLRWPDAADNGLALRLARRETYDALDGIAAAAQRTRVEPERVRVPLYALATLLARSQVLLAHLASIKLLLARRAGELDRAEAEAALAAAVGELERRLAGGVRAETVHAAAVSAVEPAASVAGDHTATVISDRTAAPVADPTATVVSDHTAATVADHTATAVAGHTAALAADPAAATAPHAAAASTLSSPLNTESMSAPAAAGTLMPWLKRRLQLAAATGGRVADAARALRAVAEA